MSERPDPEELPVDVPRAPALPEPPPVRYQRPVAKPDPAERFLKGRGIGGQDAAQMGKGFSIGTALVGSIIGGVVVGWLADTYLIQSATPWGLIAGFVLGCVSGFANLIKLANAMNRE
jgi:hypothetical protein